MEIKTKITRRKDGYEIFTYEKKIKYVHRYLAEIHIPNPENKCCINHKDGNPSNNSLDNLEWVSHKENLIHARDTGLWGKNILDKRKLTWSQVDEIRNKFKPKIYGYEKLAQEYCVDRKTIWDVVKNNLYIKTKGGHLGL